MRVRCQETLSCIYHFPSGVLLLGGRIGDGVGIDLKTDEIFPSQDCLQSICIIPDLDQGRVFHTLSILSSGSFVVCGGYGEEKSDPEDDSGDGNEGYGNEGNSEGYGNVEGNGNNSANNSSAGNNTRSTKGPLDTCLVLTNYGAANASWVLHDTKMRFELFHD